MIRKYESFLDIFRKSKRQNVSMKQIKKSLKDVFYKMKEISEDTFFDIGYSVKNSTGDGMTLPYVQIVKGVNRKGIEIPFNFKDVKDDVLTFHNRMKEEDINLEFAFVYENDKGGLSSEKPTYDDLESGLYDEREVSILTIYTT